MDAGTISVILITAGIGLMLYGLYLARDIRKALQHGTVKEAWDVLSILIVFFILGYLGYVAKLAMGLELINRYLLIATIFFLGSVFVALTAYLNRNAFTSH
jgi:hypothetical protein